MQRAQPARGDAGEHGLTDDLVPEHEPALLGVEHPRHDALVDGVGVDTGQRQEQSRLRARAHDRGRLQGLPRVAGQSLDPRQHGVLHRGGQRPPPEAMTSVTKNGLPPVRRCSALASRPVPAESRATASRLSGGTAIRRTAGSDAMSPTMTRTGSAGASRSSRYVASTTAGTCSRRRARNRSRSRVETSAQCTSSTTSRTGPRVASASRVDSNSPSRSLPRTRRATSAESAGATSTSGPSGRGDDSGSQAPQSTRAPVPSRRRQRHGPAPTCRSRSRRGRARSAPAGQRLLVQTAEGRQEVGPLHQCHPLRVGAPVGARGQEGGHARQVQRPVLGQDQALELPQRRPRARSLLGEGAAGPLVGRERVGLPTGPVLRAHQQRPERLTHRVPAHQSLQLLGDRSGDAGPGEISRDAPLQCVQPQPGQPLGLGVQRVAAGELGVRPPPPQAQRLAQDGARLVGPALEQSGAAEGQLCSRTSASTSSGVTSRR